MPVLNVRNVPEALMKQLKSDAALGGVTLREHVLSLLEHPLLLVDQSGKVSRDVGTEKEDILKRALNDKLDAALREPAKKHGKHFMDTW